MAHMNPQQAEFENDPVRLKSLGYGGKEEEEEGSPDEGMDEDHEAMREEHGPVEHVHVEHDHENGEHHVHLTHEDGHKRHSMHGSVREAFEHAEAAHGEDAHGMKDQENEE